MSTGIIYGTYNESPTLSKENDINVNFAVPKAYVSDWRKYSLLSSFVAKYKTSLFNDSQSALSSLSTIINELLENAVKFASNKSRHVNLAFSYHDGNFIIETMNYALNQYVDELKQLIKELDSKDPDDLFLEKLTEAAYDSSNRSELGLISLIRNFNCDLGIKVEQRYTHDDEHAIFVSVSVALEDLE